MRRLVALRKAFRTGTGRALHAVRESQNPDDPRSARTTWWFRRPLRRLARPRRVAHRARPQVARFRSREGPFRPPRGAADPRVRHRPPGRLKRSHGFFLFICDSLSARYPFIRGFRKVNLWTHEETDFPPS